MLIKKSLRKGMIFQENDDLFPCFNPIKDYTMSQNNKQMNSLKNEFLIYQILPMSIIKYFQHNCLCYHYLFK